MQELTRVPRVLRRDEIDRAENPLRAGERSSTFPMGVPTR